MSDQPSKSLCLRCYVSSVKLKGIQALRRGQSLVRVDAAKTSKVQCTSMKILTLGTCKTSSIFYDYRPLCVQKNDALCYHTAERNEVL